MVFSSLRFVLFLVAVLLLLAPTYSNRVKKLILAAASCFFYAAWDYRYLSLLILVSVIDYWCAARIFALGPSPRRKFWLWLSVVSNLAILAYFKYSNFLIDSVNVTLGLDLALLHILLPAGISFYTFKSMSYSIDVYRGSLVPASSQLNYTTFITFFPELIAGPIVRASVFLPQMDRPVGPTRRRLLLGLNMFVLGFIKKRLIADRMAGIADPIFLVPGDYSTASLWCALIAYTIQIYCDFSGYSDMAIGVAKMLGYDLPENFNMPYLSANISEFWRRWHITLSTWLRDYLYIPLGGSRGGTARTYVNLMITMLLGGLWHGASWNFVLWGALHGGLLGVHRFSQRRRGKRALPRWLSVPTTFVTVMLLWVPFRASTFATTRTYLAGLFGAHGGARFYPEYLWWGIVLMVVGHLFGRLYNRRAVRASLAAVDCEVHHDKVAGTYFILGGRSFLSAFLITLTLGVVFYFAETSTSPFIYFQF
jgi:alginate O-acetyltransferase complex protein AlgI